MPIISIDSTFFWQIINFFLLLFIVKKYFKEPISKIINERKQKIEAELIEATKNKKEAEQLLKEAEAQINSSRKEATEIVKAAQRKAEEEAQNLAAELAEKIIKEKVDDAQEISLIDKFIAEVGEDK